MRLMSKWLVWIKDGVITGTDGRAPFLLQADYTAEKRIRPACQPTITRRLSGESFKGREKQLNVFINRYYLCFCLRRCVYLVALSFAACLQPWNNNVNEYMECLVASSWSLDLFILCFCLVNKRGIAAYCLLFLSWLENITFITLSIMNASF